MKLEVQVWTQGELVMLGGWGAGHGALDNQHIACLHTHVSPTPPVPWVNRFVHDHVAPWTGSVFGSVQAMQRVVLCGSFAGNTIARVASGCMASLRPGSGAALVC